MPHFMDYINLSRRNFQFLPTFSINSIPLNTFQAFQHYTYISIILVINNESKIRFYIYIPALRTSVSY